MVFVCKINFFSKHFNNASKQSLVFVNQLGTNNKDIIDLVGICYKTSNSE
jgi:hypothetical protein